MLQKSMHSHQKEERYKQRQIIKQQTRQFYLMKALQRRKYQPSETNFLIGKDTDDYLIDPQHSAIIKSLPQFIYKPDSFDILITKLRSSNIFEEYQALRGLRQMTFINSPAQRQIFLGVLRRGIVTTLSQFFYKYNHPYLQMKSARILKRYLIRVRAMNHQTSDFFNYSSISVQSLTMLIQSQVPQVVVQALTLIKSLAQSIGYEFMSDSNKEIIMVVLMNIVTHYQTIDLSLITGIIKRIEFYFFSGILQFEESIFSLMIQIFYKEVGKNESSSIQHMIEWVRERKFCNRICKEFTHFIKDFSNVESTQHTQLLKFIKIIVNFNLKSTSFSLLNWKSFVTSFFKNKTGIHLMHHLKIISKLEHQLYQHEGNLSNQLILIETYQQLFSYAVKHKCQLISQIVNSKIILERVQHLYQSPSKCTLKGINGLTLELLRAAPHSEEALPILKKYRFLHSYISQSGNHDCQTAKCTMNWLLQELNTMKSLQQGRQKYDEIMKIVTEDQNFGLIEDMLNNNYLNKSDQILQSLKNLRQNFKSKSKAEESNETQTAKEQNETFFS